MRLKDFVGRSWKPDGTEDLAPCVPQRGHGIAEKGGPDQRRYGAPRR
jgi:hypothetical protein